MAFGVVVITAVAAGVIDGVVFEEMTLETLALAPPLLIRTGLSSIYCFPPSIGCNSRWSFPRSKCKDGQSFRYILMMLLSTSSYFSRRTVQLLNVIYQAKLLTIQGLVLSMAWYS